MSLSIHHLSLISIHTRLQPDIYRPAHDILAASKSRNEGALETKGNWGIKGNEPAGIFTTELDLDWGLLGWHQHRSD